MYVLSSKSSPFFIFFCLTPSYPKPVIENSEFFPRVGLSLFGDSEKNNIYYLLPPDLYFSEDHTRKPLFEYREYCEKHCNVILKGYWGFKKNQIIEIENRINQHKDKVLTIEVPSIEKIEFQPVKSVFESKVINIENMSDNANLIFKASFVFKHVNSKKLFQLIRSSKLTLAILRIKLSSVNGHFISYLKVKFKQIRAHRNLFLDKDGEILK